MQLPLGIVSRRVTLDDPETIRHTLHEFLCSRAESMLAGKAGAWEFYVNQHLCSGHAEFVEKAIETVARHPVVFKGFTLKLSDRVGATGSSPQHTETNSRFPGFECHIMEQWELLFELVNEVLLMEIWLWSVYLLDDECLTLHSQSCVDLIRAELFEAYWGRVLLSNSESLYNVHIATHKYLRVATKMRLLLWDSRPLGKVDSVVTRVRARIFGKVKGLGKSRNGDEVLYFRSSKINFARLELMMNSEAVC